MDVSPFAPAGNAIVTARGCAADELLPLRGRIVAKPDKWILPFGMYCSDPDPTIRNDSRVDRRSSTSGTQIQVDHLCWPHRALRLIEKPDITHPAPQWLTWGGFRMFGPRYVTRRF